MPARAVHGIRLNVGSVDIARQFYLSLGMVEDIGMRRTDAEGRSILGDGDPAGSPGTPSIALRWPNDPFMHLNLVAHRSGAPTGGWPKSADQIGSTVMTLLVDDVDAEIDRLRREGRVVRADAVTTERLGGPTRSAFIQDPDDNFVELLERRPAPSADHSKCSVLGAKRTWLHMQLNTFLLGAMSDFYAGFGFSHDALSDSRPNVDYRQLIDMSKPNPYTEAFGQPLSNKTTLGVSFFRLPDDHSEMHIEIMGWAEGRLVEPGPRPTFHQRGVMRYCFKAADHRDLLAELKRQGAQVYLEDQRGAYAWGDSEWFYFGDPDGNILCFEEWFPTGHWGERF